VASRQGQAPGDARDIEQRRSTVARLLATLERPTQVSVRDSLVRLGWDVSEATVRRDIKHIRSEWRERRIEDLSDYMERTLAELNAVIADCRRAISGGFRETETVQRKYTGAVDHEGRPIAGLQMAEEIRTTHPAKPNTGAMATLVRALEHRDRVMGLLDMELAAEVRTSRSGRVFAFTLRLGNKLTPSQSTPADAAAGLPANTDEDDREVVVVEADGKHRPVN